MKTKDKFDGYIEYGWACSNGQEFILFTKGFKEGEIPDVAKILTRKRVRKLVPIKFIRR